MATEKRTTRRPKPGPILSVDEINTKLDGECILLEVTEVDERKNPTHGRILAHSPNPDDVIAAVPSREAHPGPLYLFEAEPRITSGPEYEQAMREFVDLVNARLEAARRGMA